MSKLEIIAAVDAFEASKDPIEALLAYPGPRPIGSFLTDGQSIGQLPVDYDEFRAVTDEYLNEQQLPLLEDRTPALAYGANANPAKLRTKMAAYGQKQQKMMQTVPHIAADLPGMLAVWHGRPGQVGSVFAELYKSDKPGHLLRAHVAFLTDEQLAAIHISEGVTYSAAKVKTEYGPALAYVALEASILLKDEAPVVPTSLNQESAGLAALSAEQAVDYMLAATQGEHGHMTARSFIAEGQTLNLREKKARQARLGRELIKKGISRPYRYPAEAGDLIGRADFCNLPGAGSRRMLAVPEMVVASIRPDTAEINALAASLQAKDDGLTGIAATAKARRLYDPARRLSQRAHEELAIRLQND